jgi:hypothetical protein
MDKIISDLEAWFKANGATVEADASAVIKALDTFVPSFTVIGKLLDWAGAAVAWLEKVNAPDPTAGEG